MKFLEGAAGLYELGIDYHSSADIPDSNGGHKERYVLSKTLTPEQEQELSKYENVKISKNGATHKYAPEMKYDVLYISYSADDMEGELGEEVAEEAFEDENPDELQVMAELDSEIENTGIPAQSLDRYGMISQAIPMANDMIMFYRQLKENFPDDAVVIDELIESSLKQVGTLQSLIQKDPEVSGDLQPDSVQEVEPTEEPAEEAFEDENTGVNPTDTQGAYQWFLDNFDQFYDASQGVLDEEGFQEAMQSSGYSTDLLNWIWYNLSQLDDDGYSYEEFITLCGGYPGEGNWTEEDF